MWGWGGKQKRSNVGSFFIKEVVPQFIASHGSSQEQGMTSTNVSFTDLNTIGTEAMLKQAKVIQTELKNKSPKEKKGTDVEGEEKEKEKEKEGEEMEGHSQQS